MTFKKRHATANQERRDHRLGVRVSESEQREVSDTARLAKMSQTDMILFLVRRFRNRLLKKI
jgi:hypothetical protein